MMQRIPKAESKMKKLKPAQKALFYDMICALVGSPLTSENDRKKVVSGMSNLSTEFLDSIHRNRATALEGLLKKASKDSKYGRRYRGREGAVRAAKLWRLPFDLT